MGKKERYEKARHFIAMVGLDGFERRYPAELSGGMRQRVSLARTLAFEPKILLMDEPFASLDEQTRLLLGDKVLQIQQELKQTTLLITHNITEAVQLSDRVLVMSYRPGRLKQIVDINLPRPRTSEVVGSTEFGGYVARIWADLREEATRGLAESEARSRNDPVQASPAQQRPGDDRWRVKQAPPAPRAGGQFFRGPGALGMGSLLAVGGLLEALLRLGILNPFIIPPPSQVIASLWRVIVEESIPSRFLLTAGEALTAGVMITLVGVPAGLLLRRCAAVAPRDRDVGSSLRRRPCGAGLSAVPRHLRAQRLDHHHDRLRRRSGAGDPEDPRRPHRGAARPASTSAGHSS